MHDRQYASSSPPRTECLHAALLISVHLGLVPVVAAPQDDGLSITPPTKARTVVRDRHTVIINSDGVSPEVSTFEPQLDDLFRYVAAHPLRNRIVVFIHGGRVSLKDANRLAAKLIPEIEQSDPTAYPIFVNWEAGAGTSYFRHLVYERNGVSYRGTPAAPLSATGSPLVFLADVGRGLFRLPLNTLLSFGKAAQNVNPFYRSHSRMFPTRRRFNETLQSLSADPNFDPRKGLEYRPSGNGPAISLSFGSDSGGSLGLANITDAALTIPLQFSTEPILTPSEQRLGKTCFGAQDQCFIQPAISSRVATSRTPLDPRIRTPWGPPACFSRN